MVLPLQDRITRWDYRRRYERGEATIAQLAVLYGYPPSTMHYIVHTTTEPDLYGLDLDTALKASSVRVPLDRVAYFLATQHTHTLRQQVEETGLCLNIVRRCRYQLGRVGLLDHSASVWEQTRRQRRQKQARIVRLLQQGLTRKEVAEACETTVDYVHTVAASHGGVTALQAHLELYSELDVIRLLGMTRQAVAASIADGLLNAPRVERWQLRGNKKKKHAPTRYTIRRADICAFLRNRKGWPRLSLALITDPDLKRYTTLQQQTAGGAWRSQDELALLAGINRRRVWEWRKAGWLEGWDTTTYGRAIFFWQPNGVELPKASAE